MRLLILLLIFTGTLFSQEKSDFHSYDIIIKIEKQLSLAAWQIELTYDKNKTKITAIEGGDQPFAEPADYDSRGLTAGKIILASFTLKKSEAKREFKVARIHIYGPEKAISNIKLTVAADSKGKKIKASALLRGVKTNE